MPTDRDHSPPVTPYQFKRRQWLDYVTALNAAAQLEANDHTRSVWRMLQVFLTAACPKRGHKFPAGAAERAARTILADHMKRCTCRDDDWKWFTDIKPDPLEGT